MADRTDLTEATEAALHALGWPDDRDQPASDGVPAGAHWAAASDVIAAVAPLLVEQGRRQGWREGYGQGRDDEAAGLPLRTEPAGQVDETSGQEAEQ